MNTIRFTIIRSERRVDELGAYWLLTLYDDFKGVVIKRKAYEVDEDFIEIFKRDNALLGNTRR